MNTLLFLALTINQPQAPEAPPQGPPMPTPPSFVDKSKPRATEKEILASGPAAVFVRVPARKMMFIQPWNVDSWDGDETPRIVLVVGKNQRSFYPDSTDEGLEVRFREMQRGGGEPDDGAPFLQAPGGRACPT